MKTTAKTTAWSAALVLLSTAACGSSEDDHSGVSAGGSSGTSTRGGSGGTADTGGSGGSSGSGGSAPKGGTGGSSKGGSSGTSGKGGGASGSGGMATPFVPGEPCNSVDTALPPKPCMVNVAVKMSGGSADIRFHPVDGAVDYRVYELPADGDISEDGDVLTVKNATYRCSGTRQVPAVPTDDEEQLPGGAIKTFVDGQMVGNYARTLEEATLGYVSPVPGEGLVPVYAFGDPGSDADNSCFFQRFRETRVKEYVTTEAAREDLWNRAYRSDGIVFYVPEGDGDGTRAVLTSKTDSARFYFVDGPEAAMRSDSTTAFAVFAEPADGLVPLMRVFHLNGCGRSHDELMAGATLFEQARRQGDEVPKTVLHWSGVSGPTTLVIEALADGCPGVSGNLAAEARGPHKNLFDVDIPVFLTMDEARGLSPDGEVYINGQFDQASRPRPIARSFVKVEPKDPPELDWFEGFDGSDPLGEISDQPCGNPINCGKEYRESTAFGELHYLSVEDERWLARPVLGELWVNYADEAADTPGKFRLTANTRGTLENDNFLYVTMEVNAFTTGRRYPQILVSDQEPPVQHNLVNGRSLVIQPFGDWPYIYQVEVCDHRTWDVNNQCPTVDLYRYFEPGTTDKVASLAPNAEVGEKIGADSSTHFEAWVSPSRAYLYLDGEPYACVELPSGAPGEGPVTVTFGDTLYHSGVDPLEPYRYMKENFQVTTSRHFDNLGFKSGVPSPVWDESRLPCVTGFID